jgi:hypothetical protein
VNLPHNGWRRVNNDEDRQNDTEGNLLHVGIGPTPQAHPEACLVPTAEQARPAIAQPEGVAPQAMRRVTVSR